jgi:hypothetical protein
MKHTENMRLMKALEDARELVKQIRISFAGGNEFTYAKLYNVDLYLGKEQVKLGQQMFGDTEAELTAAEYSAEWSTHANA